MLTWRVKFLCALSILGLFCTGAANTLAESPDYRAIRSTNHPNASVQHGVLNVPAASFRPFWASNHYTNYGSYISQINALEDFGNYYAPVHLPQGATVTKMTFYFKDNIANNGLLYLFRSDTDINDFTMAQLSTAGSWASPSYGSASTTTIESLPIDNSRYTYYLNLILPDSDGGNFPINVVWITGVYIEYDYPLPVATNDTYSMSMAEFTPYEDGYYYANYGSRLYRLKDPNNGTNNGWYVGQVSLPDGATVTKVEFFYFQTSTAGGWARLQRANPMEGSYVEMATIPVPTGTLNFSSASDDTVANAVIDNDAYTYWVVIDIPTAFYVGANPTFIAGSVFISFSRPQSDGDEGIAAISTASFIPKEDGYEFQNHARYLFHLGGAGFATDSGSYMAPVNLPDGAFVTSVRFYWYDDNDILSSFIYLYRIPRGADMSRGSFLLAYANSSNPFANPFFSTQATDLKFQTINNKDYTYWLLLYLNTSTGAYHPAAGGMGSLGVSIRYLLHPPVYLPSILTAATP